MARICQVLRYVLAAATVVLLALTAWQCIDIYSAGDGFTRENIAMRLGKLAAPWAIYAVLAAATVIIGSSEKNTAKMTAANRLRLAKSKAGVLNEAALREEKLRKWVYAALGAVLAVCAAFSAAFLLNGDNFVSWELETVMGRLIAHLGPWVAAAFAAAIAALHVCDRSMKREAAALNEISGGAQQAEHTEKFPVNAVRVVIFAAAVVLIVVGVFNGGMRDVLIKAINICTECIGLG